MTTPIKTIFCTCTIVLLLQQGQCIQSDADDTKNDLLEILHKATDVIKKECLGIDDQANYEEVLMHSVLNQGYIIDRLTNIIKKRCLKNANQNRYKEVLKKLNKLKERCWNSVLLKNFSSPEELSKYCSEHTEDVIKCLTKLGEKLEPCLEPKERYLKQFIVESYKRFSTYFCDNIGVLRELNQTVTECNRKFLANPKINPHKVCYATSDLFQDNSKIEVITKMEMCYDLQNIRVCYNDMFQKHCPDAVELREFYSEIIKKVIVYCFDVLVVDGSTEPSENATKPSE